MFRRFTVAAVAAATALALAPQAGMADDTEAFTPGAPGVGDPYYPNLGNGGYDVQRYHLDLKYDPASDILGGTVTITAEAAQNLSRFNLDLHGLHVQEVKVDGDRATVERDGDELRITPRHGLRRGCDFTVKVRYSGIPEPVANKPFRGFTALDDGAVVTGAEPGLPVAGSRATTTSSTRPPTASP